MDLYRLDSLDEIIDLGLDDYFFGEGVCVVEWAEKGLDAFDGEHIRVSIEAYGRRKSQVNIQLQFDSILQYADRSKRNGLDVREHCLSSKLPNGEAQ